MSQLPSRSPSIRSERNFRSSNVGVTTTSSPSSNTDANNTNRRSILLSPNQLNRINKRLANIRYESVPPTLHDDEHANQHNPTSTNQNNSFSHQHVVGDFSVKIQEYAMMEDILFVLMGIDGTYIKCNYPKGLNPDDEDTANDDTMEDIQADPSYAQPKDVWEDMKYNIDPTLDPSIKHLVEKILPLATYYLSIHSFVEQFSRYEYGTVNHALCAGIREFLKDHMIFVSQIENEFQTSTTFTLQRLWFYAQEYLQTLKIVNNLVTTIRSIRPVDVSKDEEDNIDAVIEDLQQQQEGAQDEIRISERQKGGSILNILAERLIGLSGDPKCNKIYTYLLSKASVPYFDILNSWIYRGEINDPYNEFMILEKKSVKKENLKEDYNDTYWETRYTIREDYVPVFLEPIKDQILLAGKFLNVVRECGVEIANPEEMQNEILGHPVIEEPRSSNPSNLFQQASHNYHNHIPSRGEVWTAVNGSGFVQNLEIAYKYANQKLLNLLMKEQQLLERLRSLKHYFFLDQSDFITSFLDLAKDELKQLASEIPQTRLQSLMDLVLRNPSSVAAYDPFKEDVKVAMSPLRLIDQLLRIISVSGLEAASNNPHLSTLLTTIHTTGFERPNQSLSSSFMSNGSGANISSTYESLTGYDALVLDYTVTFPLSLIISRKALTKYQLLFRHILNLKHVEELLCGAWMDQKYLLWKTRSSSSQIEQWKFRVFSLRNRMLTFVQQIAYYVTNEVLEPNWRRLEANLTNITTVDQVLQYHSDFLDSCLKECMLTNSKLLRIFNKLIGSCLAFTAQAEKYNDLLIVLEEGQAKDRYGVPIAGLNDTSHQLFDSSSKALSKIEESFLYHMKLLIDALNFYSAQETVQFLCLVIQLDYNQFYYHTSISKEQSRSSSRQR